jgi:hypothetical protein
MAAGHFPVDGVRVGPSCSSGTHFMFDFWLELMVNKGQIIWRVDFEEK